VIVPARAPELLAPHILEVEGVLAIQVGSVDAATAAAAITTRVRGYLRMLGAVRP
jgi:hypothetical protein